MKSFYTSCNCALSCEDGVHRVDLQTPKKLKILNKSFFSSHNGISSHLSLFWINFYPIYMEIMGNQNFEFCTFVPFFANQQSVTLLFQKPSPYQMFEILILSLFHTLMKTNYRKEMFNLIRKHFVNQ